MTSRSIDDLNPAVHDLAQQVLLRAEDEGIDILIYSTLRTFEDQARLYRKGRSIQQIIHKATQLQTEFLRPDLSGILMDVGPQAGQRIVTWAGPGQSLHNYGVAFDAVPLRDGKPVWGSSEMDDLRIWKLYGSIGVDLGLEWAGNWPERKREFPHMQQAGANWRDLIQG